METFSIVIQSRPIKIQWSKYLVLNRDEKFLCDVNKPILSVKNKI